MNKIIKGICVAKIPTNEEWINSLSPARGMIEIVSKHDDIMSTLNNCVEGSNMYNRLCERYSVDTTHRGSRKRLYDAMFEHWLKEERN